VDDEIRAALRRGEYNAAFRLLEREYARAVYAACCRVLRNRSAADDVMQEVMMVAFKRRKQLCEVERLRGWLMQVAMRKCIDALRRSKRADKRHDDVADADIVDGRDLFDLLASTEERRALEACLAGLESEVIVAVLMRHHEGMSWDEIGDTVGMASDTVRMRVHRGALKRLRECMESKGITS
jgi:RNA polymerase sigma-70 factor, ECF subfamily